MNNLPLNNEDTTSELIKAILEVLSKKNNKDNQIFQSNFNVENPKQVGSAISNEKYVNELADELKKFENKENISFDESKKYFLKIMAYQESSGNPFCVTYDDNGAGVSIGTFQANEKYGGAKYLVNNFLDGLNETDKKQFEKYSFLEKWKDKKGSIELNESDKKQLKEFMEDISKNKELTKKWEEECEKEHIRNIEPYLVKNLEKSGLLKNGVLDIKTNGKFDEDKLKLVTAIYNNTNQSPNATKKVIETIDKNLSSEDKYKQYMNNRPVINSLLTTKEGKTTDNVIKKIEEPEKIILASQKNSQNLKPTI